jgi:hypothetical protein
MSSSYNRLKYTNRKEMVVMGFVSLTDRSNRVRVSVADIVDVLKIPKDTPAPPKSIERVKFDRDNPYHIYNVGY